MFKYTINNSFANVPNMDFISYLGKYCCESGCCDIPKELQEKGYIPALPLNLTIADPRTKNSVCYGTQCGDYCMENVYGGTCCPNQKYGCPQTARCCGNSYSDVPWCCKKSQLCSRIRNMCINSLDACDGTQCGSYCHEGRYLATCCDDPAHACSLGSKCCYVSYRIWCCLLSENCGSVENKCTNTTDICIGTKCGSHCHRSKTPLICCNNPKFACPDESKCCRDSKSDRYFCCKKSQQCGSTMDQCINSAVTISTAIMSMLFSVKIGLVSKYFL